MSHDLSPGGGLSGYVGSGKPQGAELGAGEALAFAGVHFVKSDLGIAPDTVQGAAESAGLHGLVGGFFSVASRGKFSSGFLAAGTGDLAGNGDSSQVDAIDLVKHALVGGVGSVLGGGKFENGAETGSFGYLFNELLHIQLNGQGGTLLVCDTCNPKGMSWQAFSGNGDCTNNPSCIAVSDSGPIPPGSYYIVQHGTGTLGWLWDALRWLGGYSSEGNWFELWSTKTNSDELTVDGVQRDYFRLHPVGPMGLSEGCVTVCSGFDILRQQLLSTPMGTVPGTNTEYYGKLTVTAPHD